MTGSNPRAVLVVCDALQRDFIGATTPTLAALRQRSAHFAAVTGVFPSMTRVTSASIATGCWPGSHGLIGNNMVLDEGGGPTCLSVGAPDFVERLRRATGRTLNRKVLAERLRDRAASAVYSNVSAGAAYFHDPDGFGHVFHREGSFGPGRRPVAHADRLDVTVGAAGDTAMTERFCREALSPEGPRLAVLWLSEPDWSGHTSALGSPQHAAGLRSADACVARVLADLEGRKTGDDTLLVVCSDHGMQTIRDEVDLTASLVAAGLKEHASSTDVMVAPNGTAALIHVANAARVRVPRILAFLAEQPWVGHVWSGRALESVGLREEGTLAIAVASNVSATTNAFGNLGASVLFNDPLDAKSYIGRGMHGGVSAAEQSPFLMVLGGGFQAGARQSQASLIDIAPTILRHFGLAHDDCDGSPLPLA